MNKRALKRTLNRAGFTLIELLVVIAITAILLGLIFGPMIQGFNLTNRARVQVLAQDSARSAMEVAQREVSNAVFVFHNLPRLPGQLLAGEVMEPNAISIWVRDSAANPQRILLPYGMLDFVPPARVQDQNVLLSSSDIDPTTGLAVQRGDVALPLAPGRTITRYWIGLRNNAPPPTADPTVLPNGRPGIPYGNFYENPREVRLNEHNPVSLFRATISPFTPNLVAGRPQPDLRFFHVDGSGQPIMYDPNFFYDNTRAGAVTLPGGNVADRVDGWRDLNGDGAVQICENWRALAQALVPVDRADLVVADRDDQKRTVYYPNAARGLSLPRLASQCRFQPTYVGNDAGAPSAAGDVANEAPQVAPSAFRETNGHWTLPYRAYVYRSPLTAPIIRYFMYDGTIINEGANYRINIRDQDYDTSSGAIVRDDPVAYRVQAAHYDAGRPWLTAGERPNIIFNVDERRGVINFAMPHSLVMGWELAGSQWREVPAEFFPEEPNQNWTTASGLGSQGFRYINLADLVFPPPPGTVAPTSAARQSPLATQIGGGTYIPNVSIVPGSEVVIGPDMRPGPHYGQPIAYTRVRRSFDPLTIGPNEYMINYTDILPIPSGLTALPAVQRMGTIIFDSNEDQPGQVRHSLPTVDGLGNRIGANIQVTYKIQNNLRSDIVKADYLTRQLMTIALGVRLFEFNSGQPQQVTLTQKIKVRNLQR